MRPNMIATATAAEIEEAKRMVRQKLVHSPKVCTGCGEPFTPVRSWQHFCTTRCKNTYHNEAQQREIQRLQGIILTLERDVSELRTELSKRPEASL